MSINIDYHLVFSLAPGIGPKKFLLLTKVFGTSEKAYHALCNDDLRLNINNLGIGDKTITKIRNFQKTFLFSNYQQKLDKKGVTFISQIDKKYPKDLMQLQDPPIGLFVKGDISCLLSDNKIGVVGTRKITSYGKQVTEKFTSELVLNNFTIVSGLALGVDAYAHKTALDSNGLTIAVLACGVDCCYPRENQSLFNEILKKEGLIISEYPLASNPSKGTFLARNRIIAALSDGILIPEAGADSGSLVTAGVGYTLGKKIFSVPGPITSTQSEGTSSLLKKGAFLAQTIDDITSKILAKEKTNKISKRDFSKFTLDEQTILNILLLEPMSLNELTSKTKIPIQKLSMLITELEIKGVIMSKESGVFSL